MSIAQKLPLARTLTRFARVQIADAFQRSGQALPCSVIAVVSSGIVTVKFEVNSAYTLPEITIPLYGCEYIRYPIQVGCKGFTVPADASIAGLSGLGTGIADLTEPGNLGALVFLPFGNAGWFATPDPNSVVIYGPNGVQLRDTGNASNVTLTPSGIVMRAPALTTTTTGDTDMTAAAFILNGPVTINGTLHTTGAVTVNSTVTATGEVTGNGIPLSTHLTSGVQTGGGTSGPPIA